MDEKILQNNFDKIHEKMNDDKLEIKLEITELKKDVEYIKKEMQEKKDNRKSIVAVAVTSGIALLFGFLNFFKGG